MFRDCVSAWALVAALCLVGCASSGGGPPGSDASADGAPDGAPDAAPDGAPDGSPDGAPDGGPDGGCVDLDDDGYGEGCAAGPDCADDDPAVNPGATELCNGVDDDCNDTVDDGLTAPSCASAEGVCAGAVATCGGVDGWLECGATEYGADYEVDETACDGLDNDCDGSTDEADCPCAAGDTQPCGSDVGACMPGTQSCAGGVFGACEGDTGPMGESCNGVDDDCDGEADEPADLTAPDCPLQLGVCAGAERACGGTDGWSACSGTASYGLDYEAAETSCDGLDNDCDGIVDDSCTCLDGDTQPCGTDIGACMGGSQTCVSGAWGACIGEVVPVAETCDGSDEDCDGDIDDDLSAPACALTLGVCTGSSQPCSGAGGFVACGAADYGAGYEADETSCDGRDNDCDGTIDEGCDCVTDDTQPCGVAAGVCERGTQTCIAGAWGACEGGVDPGAEVCNGLDDDCNGVSDDISSPPSCALSAGVCAGALQECGGAGGFTACSGTDSYGLSYLADEDGAADEAHCDGLDNDCDGTVDEGCSSGPILSLTEDLISPDVYGNHAVFLGNADGNWDVFFIDFRNGELRRLTTTTENESDPVVHGRLVAYTRGEDAAARVHLYDLETDMDIELSTAQSGAASVNRGFVAFDDARGGNFDIYLHDVAMGTDTAVLTSTDNEVQPDLRVPNLSYSSDAGGTFIAHVVDLSVGTDTAVAATAAGNQLGTVIDFAFLGWSDARDVTDPADPMDDWDIWGAALSDLSMHTELSGATASQLVGDVDGALFVWSDFRAGNWDVYISSLGGTEADLTSSAATQADPTISGNLVIWQDNRLGSFDLYASVFGVAAAEAGDVSINEVLADPAADAPGDANGDGTRSASDDELVEVTNNTAIALDISGLTISDGTSVRHTFPANTVLHAGGSIVVFGGGTPTGLFGASEVQVASSGSLSLGNGGDTVTLADASGTTLDTMTYAGEGAMDQSLVRVPERSGAFELHGAAAGAGGRLFSPGTVRDGFAF